MDHFIAPVTARPVAWRHQLPVFAGLGFQAIVLAAGAAPAKLLDALAADVAQGRFR